MCEIGAPAIEPLIGMLTDSNQDTRRAAAESLVKMGAPAVEPLCAALKLGRNESICRAAAEVLGRLGGPSAVEALCCALKNDKASVREAAAESLIKIGAPAVKPLNELLKDDVWYVRRSAAVASGKLGDPYFVEQLNTVLLQDTIAEVRVAAAEALGQISAPHAAESLVAGLKDSSLLVRKAAAESLKRMYHSGSLNEEGRQIISAQRQTMVKINHTDKVETHPNPHCYGPGEYDVHTDVNADGVYL